MGVETGETEAGETQVAIMEAAFRALCTHGYSNLTIDRINGEFDKSKSLLYYHYDDKDEILLNLLDYTVGQFTIEDTVDPSDDPDIRLQTLIEEILPWTLDAEPRSFQIALHELRSQALSHEEYRERFARFDQFMSSSIAEIIADGIEEDVFRQVDTERAAEHIYATIAGAMFRRITTDDESAIRTARQGLNEYIDSYLITGED
jgi:AcrR family transcriptional regulator